MNSDSATRIRVERLTPARRDDFLHFFYRLRDGTDAATCAAGHCYCHYFHVATAIPWDTLDANANRVAMAARIDAGEMDGFLAYADEKVAGWLNAQPCHKLSHLASRLAIPPLERDVPAHEAAAIVCFVIDPSCQQHEIAGALLATGLPSLRQRGLRMVDAFPRTTGQSGSSHPDHGTLEFFLAAGFSVERKDQEYTIVRKRFA